MLFIVITRNIGIKVWPFSRKFTAQSKSLTVQFVAVQPRDNIMAGCKRCPYQFVN